LQTTLQFITINMMQPNNQYYQPQTPPGPLPGGIPSIVNQVPPTGVNGARHSSTGLIVAIIILVVLLLGSLLFGFWAFTGRQDYKNNVDAKIAVAVVEAEKLTTEKNTLAFAEESKSPLKEYVGPSSYGSVTVKYPKTWSGYVAAGIKANEPLNAAFHPDVVPATQSSKSPQAIALKVRVVNEPYDNVVEELQGYIEQGKTSASPYALPKMPEQVGMMFKGAISNELSGVQVVLPLRDKTLVITTESDQYISDLETHILPNITFVP
jgi:hypothetical protein